LINKTVDQINQVAGDRDPTDRDEIIREPPDPNAVRVQPITSQAPDTSEIRGALSAPASMSPDSNTPVSLFTRSLSAGPDVSLAAGDMASPPLQPDARQDETGNSQARFLVRRTYDPSQGSPYAAQPALSSPSPDRSLSLNDAYLEHLKRLNVASSAQRE
jgi:hypothetical protein